MVLQASEIRFDDAGLVPCVVQDWASGEVLTLAYMNADALELTQTTGQMHFWSRSRRKLWHKGESSGNTQQLMALRYDCDGDALLAIVRPSGPACHTGERSCFHQGGPETGAELAPHEVMPDLERTVAARRRDDDGGGSYTSALLADPDLARSKVLEEAQEVVAATAEETTERVAEEAADLLYHLTVLLSTRGTTLADAELVLTARRGAPRRFTPGGEAR